MERINGLVSKSSEDAVESLERGIVEEIDAGPEQRMSVAFLAVDVDGAHRHSYMRYPVALRQVHSAGRDGIIQANDPVEVRFVDCRKSCAAYAAFLVTRVRIASQAALEPSFKVEFEHLVSRPESGCTGFRLCDRSGKT